MDDVIAIERSLQKFNNEIEQLRGKRDTVLEMKKEIEQIINENTLLILYIEEGQKIAQDVALATQERLKLSIEPIVTSALDIVYKDEAYGFEVDFEVKRNKTECTLYFTRNGIRYNPLASSGFGVVDVAAFALRLALWNISKPMTRPTFILDEPFKHVSENLQEAVMEMVSTLSKKLGIQIIMISHNKESDVMEHSDRVFRVHRGNDYISKVKVIK
jgi:hypothetical protein